VIDWHAGGTAAASENAKTHEQRTADVMPMMGFSCAAFMMGAEDAAGISASDFAASEELESQHSWGVGSEGPVSAATEHTTTLAYGETPSPDTEAGAMDTCNDLPGSTIVAAELPAADPGARSSRDILREASVMNVDEGCMSQGSVALSGLGPASEAGDALSVFACPAIQIDEFEQCRVQSDLLLALSHTPTEASMVLHVVGPVQSELADVLSFVAAVENIPPPSCHTPVYERAPCVMENEASNVDEDPHSLSEDSSLLYVEADSSVHASLLQSAESLGDEFSVSGIVAIAQRYVEQSSPKRASPEAGLGRFKYDGMLRMTETSADESADDHCMRENLGGAEEGPAASFVAPLGSAPVIGTVSLLPHEVDATPWPESLVFASHAARSTPTATQILLHSEHSDIATNEEDLTSLTSVAACAVSEARGPAAASPQRATDISLEEDAAHTQCADLDGCLDAGEPQEVALTREPSVAEWGMMSMHAAHAHVVKTALPALSSSAVLLVDPRYNKPNSETREGMGAASCIGDEGSDVTLCPGVSENLEDEKSVREEFEVLDTSDGGLPRDGGNDECFSPGASENQNFLEAYRVEGSTAVGGELPCTGQQAWLGVGEVSNATEDDFAFEAARGFSSTVASNHDVHALCDPFLSGCEWLCTPEHVGARNKFAEQERERVSMHGGLPWSDTAQNDNENDARESQENSSALLGFSASEWFDYSDYSSVDGGAEWDEAWRLFGSAADAPSATGVEDRYTTCNSPPVSTEASFDAVMSALVAAGMQSPDTASSRAPLSASIPPETLVADTQRASLGAVNSDATFSVAVAPCAAPSATQRNVMAVLKPDAADDDTIMPAATAANRAASSDIGASAGSHAGLVAVTHSPACPGFALTPAMHVSGSGRADTPRPCIPIESPIRSHKSVLAGASAPISNRRVAAARVAEGCGGISSPLWQVPECGTSTELLMKRVPRAQKVMEASGGRAASGIACRNSNTSDPSHQGPTPTPTSARSWVAAKPVGTQSIMPHFAVSELYPESQWSSRLPLLLK
jgi:hypothetical protein